MLPVTVLWYGGDCSPALRSHIHAVHLIQGVSKACMMRVIAISMIY